MKIPSQTNTTPKPASGANKSSASNGNASSLTDAANETSGDGRDFASILEEVSRPRTSTRRDQESERHDATRDTATHSSAARENEARRRDDAHDKDNSGGKGFDGRGQQVHEATQARPEATNARAILHVMDLERIVASVRTQITAGGRREVTLEMQRSVLEGLRVKLSADPSGRVTAEFIAASEQVRAQVEARSAELTDLLRSRGVNLASLKTSLGSETFGGNNQQQRNSSSESFAGNTIAATDASNSTHAALASQPVDANDATNDVTTPDAAGTTYRA